jgi:hypothetical protein
MITGGDSPITTGPRKNENKTTGYLFLNALLASISLCSIDDFLGGCFVFGFSLIPSPKNLTASRSLLSTVLFITFFYRITCLWKEAKNLKVSINFGALRQRTHRSSPGGPYKIGITLASTSHIFINY